MLKRNHGYYFQCQGVMAITETEQLDFVVWTTKDFFVETIRFDRTKWTQETLPKLTEFYFNYMKDRISTM